MWYVEETLVASSPCYAKDIPQGVMRRVVGICLVFT